MILGVSVFLWPVADSRAVTRSERQRVHHQQLRIVQLILAVEESGLLASDPLNKGVSHPGEVKRRILLL